MDYDGSVKWFIDAIGAASPDHFKKFFTSTGYISVALLVIAGVLGFIGECSFYPTFISGILYALSGAVNVFGLNHQFYSIRTMPAIAFMVAGLFVI